MHCVGGQQVNVSCVSDGWSPKPSLTWRNREGRELKDQQGLFYSTDPQGLVTVSGWLLFSPSDSEWLSCTVSLSGGDSRESRVAPHTPGTELGSIPVLSVHPGVGGQQVNVSCVSDGWSPKPSLIWRNREGRELKDQQGLFYSTDPQGLVTVSGWLLFSPSDSEWLSCTVSLSGGDSREGRVAPHTPGTELGSIPVLSVHPGVGGQQVNVSCVSDGWSHKPSLIWRNREGRELKDQQGLFYSTDPQGLVTVSGWLLFSPSDSEWLSCTVSHSGGDSRESRVVLHTCVTGEYPVLMS
ncbi:hypothetical protein AAFF_G00260710 [Aldrovandia affinis]|uniref:Ig-like domain-containing protein n=1 Tax=Aldrovandia affinis TaxID=143900 RepID=A0AAD7RC88_9TELE|nr:hypothetical protein AAFF_G00260710 [Aldrovandia affinis]